MPGPDPVMLPRVGELCQGVWNSVTFTFGVLLGPCAPLPLVTTASEAVGTRVPGLEPLHFLRLLLGFFCSASLFEVLKVLFRY